jgi:hypothetical protein
MTEPKVVLKNVHFGYSREFGAKGRFDADLWINGIKCMKVIDEGNGGCIDYEYNLYKNPKYKEVEANIKLLENYIKTLPPDKYMLSGKQHTMPMDLDLYVEKKLNELEAQKFNKKMEKLYNIAVVFGKPNADRYGYINFKHPLSEIPTMLLQSKVDAIIQKHCKDGVKILNTNLGELGINL